MYFRMYKKNKTFYVEPFHKQIKASYSQIPIEYGEYLDMIKSGYFTKAQGGEELYYIVDKGGDFKSAAYENYKKWFNEKVNYYKLTNLFEVVPNKVYQLNIPGTSKLVRAPDKRGIKIARRKVKKDGSTINECRINVVPITDDLREEFFADCKALHAGVYNIKVTEDKVIFKYWSDLMDDIYNELAKEAGDV